MQDARTQDFWRSKIMATTVTPAQRKIVGGNFLIEETNPQDLGLLMAGVAERAAGVAEHAA